MDLFTYKFIHLAGVIGLFTSLGAIMIAGSGRKGGAMLHGISLLLILVAGFGALAKYKMPMDQYWWMVKIALWLFLGAAPALAKRSALPTSALLMLSLGAGIAAAYLGVFKPF